MAVSEGASDAARRGWPRGALAFLLGALALSLALTVWRVAASSANDLFVTLVCDDGYYYAQWARNLAQGRGPTLDGFEATDGVRPVWALSLVPIHALARDPHLGLQASCVWSALLHVAWVGLLCWRLGHLVSPWAAALAGAVGALATPWAGALGAGVMDWSMTALLAVALAVAVSLWLDRPASRRALAGTAVLVALNLLQRPESLLLVSILAVAALARGRRREVGLVAVGAVLFALPAVLVSIAVFGAYGSVAGELKARHSLDTLDPARFLAALERSVVSPLVAPFEGFALRFEHDLLTGSAAVAVAFVVAVLLAVGWLARGRVGGERAVRDAVVRALLAAAVLHSLVVAVLLHQQLWYGRWYLAAQDVAVVVLVAFACDGLARRLPRRGAVAAAAALLALLAVGVARFERDLTELRRAAGATPPAQARTVEWLAEHVPATTRVGAHNAGFVSYHAVQPVTNLDGLMNSRRFAQACLLERDEQTRKLNLLRYLVESDIEYLVDPWHPALREDVVRIAFGSLAPLVSGFFERVALLEMPPGADSEYHVWRLDVERARAALVAAGIEPGLTDRTVP